MKRLLPTLLLVIGLSAAAHAQVHVGGQPFSQRAGLQGDPVPTLSAAPFDASLVAAQDKARADAGALPMYGRQMALNASLGTNGVWTELANGDRLWRLRIVSAGALATELFFEDFFLPENAILHVYTERDDEVLGGFTSANNKEHGRFATGQLMGEDCVVEYYEPLEVRGLGSFTITSVGHAYRFIGGAKAQDCEVDVNCAPEGTGQQAQRDAVVRISVVEGGQLGWCSGTLVNNVEQDCKAYYLTAFHCGVGASAADFNAWKFYFKYQRTGCGTGNASTGSNVTGCTKRADSNDNGGASGSDFLLLEGEDAIPTNFNPHWLGWDANNVNPGSGVKCIHHPAGDEKKISTVNVITSSSAWNGISAQTHWRTTWSATTNGHGVTEGGSSGSPIYNNSGQLIGTLTGGSSYCNSVVPGGQNQPDFYGKMSYHWESNGGPATDDLKYWLDPNNTGTKVMNGSYGPCGTLGLEEGASLAAPGVFPNPAAEVVRITVPAELSDARNIDVLDLSGRLVLRQRVVPESTNKLDVRELATGTYVVRVVGDQRVSGGALLNVIH
jgi:hypothetical protein